MNREYKLVLATENDYEFIYNVKKDAYIKYVEENWGPWDEEFQREKFSEYIDEYKKSIYIVVSNKQKIGFYHGELLDNGEYEIVNICIIPKYQGFGIGSDILKNVLKENQNRNIHIQYFKQNPVGELYKRLGFKFNIETEFHYKMVKESINK